MTTREPYSKQSFSLLKKSLTFFKALISLWIVDLMLLVFYVTVWFYILANVLGNSVVQ